jgi:hypothetical protein
LEARRSHCTSRLTTPIVGGDEGVCLVKRKEGAVTWMGVQIDLGKRARFSHTLFFCYSSLCKTVPRFIPGLFCFSSLSASLDTILFLVWDGQKELGSTVGKRGTAKASKYTYPWFLSCATPVCCFLCTREG